MVVLLASLLELRPETLQSARSKRSGLFGYFK